MDCEHAVLDCKPLHIAPDQTTVPGPFPPHPFRTGRRHEISPAIVTVTNLKADPPPVKNPAAELRGGC